MTSNTIWLDDPVNILLNPKTLHMIIPNRGDSLNEQVNAFTRFILLYGTLLSVYKQSWDPIFWSLLVSVGVLVIVLVVKKNRKQYMKSESNPTNMCVATKDNPFANPSVGTNESKCNMVVDESDRLFTQNLPLDEWDIYGKNNSQRQFFTLPQNDQTSFAKWLYNPGDVCKTTPSRCAYY